MKITITKGRNNNGPVKVNIITERNNIISNTKKKIKKFNFDFLTNWSE